MCRDTAHTTKPFSTSSSKHDLCNIINLQQQSAAAVCLCHPCQLKQSCFFTLTIKLSNVEVVMLPLQPLFHCMRTIKTNDTFPTLCSHATVFAVKPRKTTENWHKLNLKHSEKAGWWILVSCPCILPKSPPPTSPTPVAVYCLTTTCFVPANWSVHQN